MKNSEAIQFQQLNYLRKRYPMLLKAERGIFDTPALVDVVLIFILFLIVSSSYVTQPGIRIELPVSSEYEGIPFSSYMVTLSQEGLLFFNDERTTMDGLSEALQRMAYERPDETLVIQADEQVRHSVLVNIYNKALAAGISDIAIATRFVPEPDSSIFP